MTKNSSVSGTRDANVPQGLLRSVRRRMPRSWKRRYHAARNVARLLSYTLTDATRYLRHSGACVPTQNIDQLDAEITRIYHAIEKGLALPQPRPAFGIERVTSLCGYLRGRLESGGPWTDACVDGVNALRGYVSFNRARQQRLPPEIESTLSLALARGVHRSANATKRASRADIAAATKFDYERFVWCRHSVRQFSAQEVDVRQILRAVDCARSTPSVCNRQSGRVTIVHNTGPNFEILRYQNGNRGFGNDARYVLIITADLNCFLEPEERYQAWIDGGMFAMSVVLGLHAQGLGTCCLNWSQTPDRDAAFRAEAGVQDNETIIMLLAVGHLREEFDVANSTRRPLDSIVRYHGARPEARPSEGAAARQPDAGAQVLR